MKQMTPTTMNRSKDMRSKIMLAMRACEPNSASPTANMMKFHDGNLVTYGGTFCVQIPCPVDAECAFIPQALLAFFRKDREKVTYTLSGDKLTVRSKREKVTIKCLPSEGMPIIDVHREVTKVKGFLNKKAVKAMLACIDPAEPRSCLQGMCLRKGLAIGTNGKVCLAMVSNLDVEITCTVPTETLKFISTIDEDVDGIAFDGINVKFTFPSGMTVCSRTLLADEFPDVRHIINVDGTSPVILHKDMLEEIQGIKCGSVEVDNKGVTYVVGNDSSTGHIDLASEGDFEIRVNKKWFELMLSLTLKSTVHISVNRNMLVANGGKFFKMTLALMVPVNPTDKD